MRAMFTKLHVESRWLKNEIKDNYIFLCFTAKKYYINMLTRFIRNSDWIDMNQFDNSSKATDYTLSTDGYLNLTKCEDLNESHVHKVTRWITLIKGWNQRQLYFLCFTAKKYYINMLTRFIRNSDWIDMNQFDNSSEATDYTLSTDGYLNLTKCEDLNESHVNDSCVNIWSDFL